MGPQQQCQHRREMRWRLPSDPPRNDCTWCKYCCIFALSTSADLLLHRSYTYHPKPDADHMQEEQTTVHLYGYDADWTRTAVSTTGSKVSTSIGCKIEQYEVQSFGGGSEGRREFCGHTYYQHRLWYGTKPSPPHGSRRVFSYTRHHRLSRKERRTGGARGRILVKRTGGSSFSPIYGV